jgi:hypothetical protein
MITKAIKDSLLSCYSFNKELASSFLRFQFPHDPKSIKIVNRDASQANLKALKEHRNYDEASFSQLE